MAVRQIGQQTFNVPKAVVANQINLVLRLNQAYKHLRALAEGTVYTVTIQPNPLLLPTRMEIVLDENELGTTVTATTTSQALIVGDVGGFYYRYVRDFLAALRDGLRANQGDAARSSEAIYKTETNWTGVAMMFLLAALLVWMAFFLEVSMVQVFAVLAVIMVVVNLVRIARGGRLGT